MLQDTSLQAFEAEVRPNLSEKQAAVRRLLMAYPDGLTNAEIAQLLRWSINRVTPRTNELVKLSVAVDSGKRECKVTGRTAHVWKLKFIPAPRPSSGVPQTLFAQ